MNYYWVILLLVLIFYILFRKSRRDPLTIMQVQNVPLSRLVQLYLDNVKQRFGEKTSIVVSSHLKPTTCVPPAQDMTVAQFDAFYKRRATDPEWNRLKSCGWLWNMTFINSLLTGEWFISSLSKKNLTYDDFIKLLQASLKTANDF